MNTCKILNYFKLPEEQILEDPFIYNDALLNFLNRYKGITGIYCINSNMLRSCYIGQSKDLKRRLLTHQKYYFTTKRYRESRSSQKFYDLVKCNPSSLTLYILEKNINVLGMHEALWMNYFKNSGYTVFG